MAGRAEGVKPGQGFARSAAALRQRHAAGERTGGDRARSHGVLRPLRRPARRCRRASLGGGETAIADTVKGEGEAILHLPAPGAALPPVGAAVEGEIDWDRRYRLMYMHTAMHLLCSLIKGAAVTGGSVGADRARLGFDLPNPPPKEQIEAGLNALIEADHPVRIEWVDEAVLDADPGLVRTMSVAPPRGTGRLRLMRIGDGDALVDLQPCGGTHVTRTGEIGRVAVVKIENKGRQNRRIIIAPAG